MDVERSCTLKEETSFSISCAPCGLEICTGCCGGDAYDGEIRIVCSQNSLLIYARHAAPWISYHDACPHGSNT